MPSLCADADDYYEVVELEDWSPVVWAIFDPFEEIFSMHYTKADAWKACNRMNAERELT
jgi:hypothetical protein